MNTIKFLTIAVLVTFSMNSNASIWDFFSNLLGGEETKEAKKIEPQNMDNAKSKVADNATTVPASATVDLLSMATESLGIDQSQAKGGLGSLLSLAKGNLSQDEFGSLSTAIPGISELLAAAPSVENAGKGNLLSMAGDVGEKLLQTQVVQQQFSALGLSTDMIVPLIQVLKTFLQQSENANLVDTLMKGLPGLTKQ